MDIEREICEAGYKEMSPRPVKLAMVALFGTIVRSDGEYFSIEHASPFLYNNEDYTTARRFRRVLSFYLSISNERA